MFYMAKKKVMKRKGVAKAKDVWFKKRLDGKSGWSFIPMNWRGWVALVLLVGVNVFAANYFVLNELAFDNWSKFAVVSLLSLAIFILISKNKTLK